MIVGSQKPIDEIWDMVKDFKKVLVFGCNTCVAICHAGGEKEAETIAALIRMRAAQEGKRIEVNHLGVMRHCEPEYFDPVMDEVRRYDLVLSTACGVGVNFLSERIGEIPVYPGINTSFFGGVPEAGVFTELCAGCGNCILHLTGGICPIARCSKTLMNGPCGGTNKGKCEVSPDIDCAWYLIVERMKKLGTLEKLYEIQPPRNWSTSRDGGPRRVSLEHIRAYEEKEEQKPEPAGGKK
ncbi:MAG: methylenetetrahydrofolate reductase C-terminal domain-containing protein [Nitrospirae bacterium]|nr:methylenetetrahydrofolate reductase C-terminal domain-containing protein [Nitrospirota bacterium]MCL5421981.1 methylenetetrahydrofolate reductase C-terminal domain-containing protein [Nitrospirota bacterium]